MIHIMIHKMIHIMINIMMHLMTYIMTNIMTNIMINVMTAWKKCTPTAASSQKKRLSMLGLLFFYFYDL